MKKSLSDYRQTPAFPQIVAVARPLLQQATPDKVLAGLQNKAASAARAEFDKTTKKVQGIVNQAPQIVTPPPGSTEVYKYSYHPGAEKPNYNADNLIGTREIWKGTMPTSKARRTFFTVRRTASSTRRRSISI